MKNVMKGFLVVCCLFWIASSVSVAVAQVANCKANKAGTLPAMVKATPSDTKGMGDKPVMTCPKPCPFTSTSNPKANGTYTYELVKPANKYCNPVKTGASPTGPGGGGGTKGGGTTTTGTTDVP